MFSTTAIHQVDQNTLADWWDGRWFTSRTLNCDQTRPDVYLNAFRDGEHLLRIDVKHFDSVLILYKSGSKVGLLHVLCKTAD